MPGNDEIDMLCAKCGRVRLHYFHTIKSMQGSPAEAERYHAYEPRISLAGTGANVFDVAMADLTASVMRIKAERDEMDEAIHAAHAATVEILPDYRADNGFPIEAVHALGEEIVTLREAIVAMLRAPHAVTTREHIAAHHATSGTCDCDVLVSRRGLDRLAALARRGNAA